MNDNAKALIAALRSGEYKQGRGTLTTVVAPGDERDCCLGVACKLAVKAGVIELPTELEDGTLAYNDGGRGESGILPEVVRAWLGFRDKGSSFRTWHGEEDQLSSRNDAGTSFAAIADLIESEPEGLFE